METVARARGGEHGRIAVGHHEGEGLRVEVIADENGRVVAQRAFADGRPRRKRRLIHHVVVDEGRRVQELDHTAHANRRGDRGSPPLVPP